MMHSKRFSRSLYFWEILWISTGTVLFWDLRRKYLYLNVDTFPPEKSASCICLLSFPFGRQGRWLCLIRVSAFWPQNKFRLLLWKLEQNSTKIIFQKYKIDEVQVPENIKEKELSQEICLRWWKVSCIFTWAVLQVYQCMCISPHALMDRWKSKERQGARFCLE